MPEMIVANNFNKISPESANRETGLNTGNKSDISTSLLSSRGVSVEKAAENIWDDNFAENPIVDVQDVRNIIIDILSSGSIKNYKESILENSTIKELKQQYNAVQEKIKAGKEINKEAKEKLKASQMSLFDKYAPEGLPKINRTPKQC
jgi:basic membrane lipoprotein Med (substrate-binding protein (PBP1-ABC) superfamily)